MSDPGRNGGAPLPGPGRNDLPGPGRQGRGPERSPGRAGFGAVLASGEYSALWIGQAQSIVGDQIARVALAVLVYDRTRSPLLAAVTYAGGFLPWLIGGLVLTALADRWPRRTVLVSCDVARGAMVAVMTVPGMPLPVMIVLLYLVSLLDGPFIAARSAICRDILDDDRFRLGVAMGTMTTQAAVVAGFAAGGIIVSVTGPRPALIINAVSFAVSALLIRLVVIHRPAAACQVSSVRARIGSGLTLVFTKRRLRTCMLLGWLAALYSVPSAVAVPLAASTGGGSTAAGLLFAAMPLGTAAGTALYGRCAGAAAQARWMGPLAVLCCGSLVLFLANPGLGWSLAILVVSGGLGCYQVTANVNFVQDLRRDQQTQAFGIAVAGIFTARGVAFLTAGAAADVLAPATVIALFGIAGAITAAALTASWRKAAGPASRPAQAEDLAGPIVGSAN